MSRRRRRFRHPSAVVIAAPDHPLAGRHPISMAMLESQRFLIREEGSGTRAAFEQAFPNFAAGAHAGDGRRRAEQAVMAGLELRHLGDTVAAELADGRLVALDVPGMPIQRQWYIGGGGSTPSDGGHRLGHAGRARRASRRRRICSWRTAAPDEGGTNCGSAIWPSSSGTTRGVTVLPCWGWPMPGIRRAAKEARIDRCGDRRHHRHGKQL